MKKYDRRLVGIFGTVIIHLIAGIIFMSLQLNSLRSDLVTEFEMEVVPAEEQQTRVKQIELPATSVEKVLQGDEEMLNIARNLANKSEEKINASDYIDKVKEELIKSGKLGVDNYIDEQKKLDRMKADEKTSIQNDTTGKDKIDQHKESQKMAANYKGPTRIYYDLIGRNHLYLPIPIYKCEGSGKVVLTIEVNQEGMVEKALIVENESTTSDPCLVETAINTALISRFNPDASSPRVQVGTLSYLFVAQ